LTSEPIAKSEHHVLADAINAADPERFIKGDNHGWQTTLHDFGGSKKVQVAHMRMPFGLSSGSVRFDEPIFFEPIAL
jgi:hypothetical protein